ncbi:MAG: NIPSNAP family containing protein [Dehalococcoidia bacterium]
MVSQLRVYVINRDALDEFVQAWLAGVYPLRLRNGYRIPAAWVSRERNEFIWLLTYNGSENWAEKEASYYASAERAAVDPDPRQFIAQANHYFLESVPLPELPPEP